MALFIHYKLFTEHHQVSAVWTLSHDSLISICFIAVVIVERQQVDHIFENMFRIFASAVGAFAYFEMLFDFLELLLSKFHSRRI